MTSILDALAATRGWPFTPPSDSCRRRRPNKAALAQTDSPVDQRLDPNRSASAARHHDPRVGGRAPIVETARDPVQSDRPVSIHHEGDLLRRPRLRTSREEALLRRLFFSSTGQTRDVSAVD